MLNYILSLVLGPFSFLSYLNLFLIEVIYIYFSMVLMNRFHHSIKTGLTPSDGQKKINYMYNFSRPSHYHWCSCTFEFLHILGNFFFSYEETFAISIRSFLNCSSGIRKEGIKCALVIAKMGSEMHSLRHLFC